MMAVNMPSVGIELPQSIPKDAMSTSVRAVIVLSDDIACLVTEMVPKDGYNPEEEWSDLIFSFFHSTDGSKVQGAEDQKFILKGKVCPNDSYLTSHVIDQNTVLLTATVEEGHYDEETWFLHGYLISNKPASVKRAFKDSFDLANNMAGCAVTGGKAYVVSSTKLLIHDLQSDDVEEAEWPHETVKYAAFAGLNGKLFGLNQVNAKDGPIDKLIQFDIESKANEWRDIGGDPKKGHLKCPWYDSNGVFVQVDYAIYAMKDGGLWLLDLTSEELQWKYLGGPIGSGEDQFLTAAGDSSLYAFDGKKSQLIKIELDRLG